MLRDVGMFLLRGIGVVFNFLPPFFVHVCHVRKYKWNDKTPKQCEDDADYATERVVQNDNGKRKLGQGVSSLFKKRRFHLFHPHWTKSHPQELNFHLCFQRTPLCI